MDTWELKTVYSELQFLELPPSGVCSICSQFSRRLQAPNADLYVYLERIGFEGDIWLCDQCLQDIGESG